MHPLLKKILLEDHLEIKDFDDLQWVAGISIVLLVNNLEILQKSAQDGDSRTGLDADEKGGLGKVLRLQKQRWEWVLGLNDALEY